MINTPIEDTFLYGEIGPVDQSGFYGPKSIVFKRVRVGFFLPFFPMKTDSIVGAYREWGGKTKVGKVGISPF